jgi:hypothetical protein
MTAPECAVTMFMWPEDNNKIISETNIASQFIQVDFLD